MISFLAQLPMGHGTCKRMDKPADTIWYERWVFPIVDALADHDEHSLDNAERRARDAIATGEVTPDIARAIEFILGYHIYLRTVILDRKDRQPSALEQALAELKRPALGTVSSRTKRCMLLQIRIIADDIGTMPLGKAEYHTLRSAISDDELHTEQWFYISKYSFKQRDLPETAKAYEQYLDEGSNWARDYNWRRFEVMVKLLENRATSLDIELLIKSMVVPGCITEMRNVIWPVIVEQGLASNHLELLLSQRAKEIADREPRT